MPGASTGRRSSSATRRPARWTRSTGPTTSSRRSRRSRHALPEWFPLVGLEFGYTNIVPVDYVAAAMDHIAHQPGLDGQAFHLADPRIAALGRVLNTFAKAAHAPQLAIRIDKRLTRRAAQGRAARCSCSCRRSRTCGARSWPTSASPRRSSATSGSPPSSTPATPSARSRASGIEVPAARHLRGEALGLLGAQPRPRPLQGPLASSARSTASTVVITGASSGIGRAAALKIAAAGGIPILVARSDGQARGDQAPRSRRPAAPRTSTRPTSPTWTSIDELVDADPRRPPRGRHARQQRRALDPPLDRAQSYDRFHDFERTMQLNYFGAIKLIMGAAAAHARARRRPHRQRLLDRRADQPAALLAPTSPRRRRSTRSRASSPRRSSATASPSPRSTCRSCARR